MIERNPPYALKSDGTKVPYEPGLGYKLGIGTYYIDVTMADAVHSSVHCSWDATIVATSVDYEVSNLPSYASLGMPYSDNSAAVDVALNADATSGVWQALDPSGGYTLTSGGTIATTTLAIAGGTAAGAFIDVTTAARRARIGIVTTTGGYFRCNAHGKQS